MAGGKILLGLLVIVLVGFHYGSCTGCPPSDSVSLTVDGGGGLVGRFCPGTVRLVCRGVGLTLLQWKYNGDTDVVTFDTDDVVDTPMAIVGVPGFESVDVDISQDSNPNFANFTSVLTADLAGLRTQGVYQISCGDLGSQSCLDVNVTIKPSDPIMPNITAVKATYGDGELTSLAVSWMPVAAKCPLFIFYSVSLGGSVVGNISHTSCGQQCSVNITEFTAGEHVLDVSTFSTSSDNHLTTAFPILIDSRSGEYFFPSLVVDGSVPVGLCGHVSGDFETCSVQYSVDPVLQDNTVTVPVNESFVVPDIATCTQYFFEFSVVVGDQLTIVERSEFILDINPPPVAGEAILVVLVVIFLILSVVITAVLISNAVKPGKIFISKYLMLTEVGCMVFTTLLPLVFFISWIGVVTDGNCRVNWLEVRVSLLVVCLLLLIIGLVIRILIIFSTRCALHRKDITVMRGIDESTDSEITSTPTVDVTGLSLLGSKVQDGLATIGTKIEKGTDNFVDGTANFFGKTDNAAAQFNAASHTEEKSGTEISESPQLKTTEPKKDCISVDCEPPRFKYRPNEWFVNLPGQRDVSVQVACLPLNKPSRSATNRSRVDSTDVADTMQPTLPGFDQSAQFNNMESGPTQLISEVETGDHFLTVEKASLWSVLTDKSTPHVVYKNVDLITDYDEHRSLPEDLDNAQDNSLVEEVSVQVEDNDFWEVNPQESVTVFIKETTM